jgi:hypothetical protein
LEEKPGDQNQKTEQHHQDDADKATGTQHGVLPDMDDETVSWRPVVLFVPVFVPVRLPVVVPVVP